mmetsp:Transcript_46513/g.83965  ORF Transcript_46513/g.83965 Transcript_46513/m.83965 type:complete len:83 (+) Transcript_46513:145-393(+)
MVAMGGGGRRPGRRDPSGGEEAVWAGRSPGVDGTLSCCLGAAPLADGRAEPTDEPCSEAPSSIKALVLREVLLPSVPLPFTR